MANAVLLGVVGKPPVGGGPNKHPASFKLAHGAGRQDWPGRPRSKTGKAGGVGGRHRTSGVSESRGEAERTILVKAVHDGNPEVVVHNAVAAANRKLVLFAKNLRDPTLARIGRPGHGNPRRKILVVPVPQAGTVILGPAQDESNFPGVVGGLASRRQLGAFIEPVRDVLIGAAAASRLYARCDLIAVGFVRRSFQHPAQTIRDSQAAVDSPAILAKNS